MKAKFLRPIIDNDIPSTHKQRITVTNKYLIERPSKSSMKVEHQSKIEIKSSIIASLPSILEEKIELIRIQSHENQLNKIKRNLATIYEEYKEQSSKHDFIENAVEEIINALQVLSVYRLESVKEGFIKKKNKEISRIDDFTSQAILLMNEKVSKNSVPLLVLLASEIKGISFEIDFGIFEKIEQWQKQAQNLASKNIENITRGRIFMTFALLCGFVEFNLCYENEEELECDRSWINSQLKKLSLNNNPKISFLTVDDECDDDKLTIFLKSPETITKEDDCSLDDYIKPILVPKIQSGDIERLIQKVKENKSNALVVCEEYMCASYIKLMSESLKVIEYNNEEISSFMNRVKKEKEKNDAQVFIPLLMWNENHRKMLKVSQGVKFILFATCPEQIEHPCVYISTIGCLMDCSLYMAYRCLSKINFDSKIEPELYFNIPLKDADENQFESLPRFVCNNIESICTCFSAEGLKDINIYTKYSDVVTICKAVLDTFKSGEIADKCAFYGLNLQLVAKQYHFLKKMEVNFTKLRIKPSKISSMIKDDYKEGKKPENFINAIKKCGIRPGMKNPCYYYPCLVVFKKNNFKILHSNQEDKTEDFLECRDFKDNCFVKQIISSLVKENEYQFLDGMMIYYSYNFKLNDLVNALIKALPYIGQCVVGHDDLFDGYFSVCQTTHLKQDFFYSKGLSFYKITVENIMNHIKEICPDPSNQIVLLWTSFFEPFNGSEGKIPLCFCKNDHKNAFEVDLTINSYKTTTKNMNIFVIRHTNTDILVIYKNEKIEFNSSLDIPFEKITCMRKGIRVQEGYLDNLLERYREKAEDIVKIQSAFPCGLIVKTSSNLEEEINMLGARATKLDYQRVRFVHQYGVKLEKDDFEKYVKEKISVFGGQILKVSSYKELKCMEIKGFIDVFVLQAVAQKVKDIASEQNSNLVPLDVSPCIDDMNLAFDQVTLRNIANEFSKKSQKIKLNVEKHFLFVNACERKEADAILQSIQVSGRSALYIGKKKISEINRELKTHSKEKIKLVLDERNHMIFFDTKHEDHIKKVLKYKETEVPCCIYNCSKPRLSSKLLTFYNPTDKSKIIEKNFCLDCTKNLLEMITNQFISNGKKERFLSERIVIEPLNIFKMNQFPNLGQFVYNCIESDNSMFSSFKTWFTCLLTSYYHSQDMILHCPDHPNQMWYNEDSPNHSCKICGSRLCDKCQKVHVGNNCGPIFKMCPKCRIPVERSNGCYVMKCRYCNIFWCYWCKAGNSPIFKNHEEASEHCFEKHGGIFPH